MTERRTDTRIPLDEGYCVKDKNSAGHSFTIKEEFARGGSSIIYRAEGADGEVLLKELFPAYGCFREDGKIKARRSGNDLLAELAVRMDTEFSIGKKAFEESAWVENIGKPFVSSDGNQYSAMKISKPHASLRDILALPECADVSIHAWIELIHRISQSVRDIHEKADVLHLDISLSNILIIGSNSPLDMLKAIASNDGRSAPNQYGVMLIDFGCSLYMDKHMQSANKYYISPTTEGYSAPELLIDGYGPVTPAADIYSICACLKKCAEKIPEEAYRNLPATVRAKLEAILRKGLAEDPMYRIRSAERLLLDLKELLSRIDGKGVSKAAIWEAAKRDYKSKLKGRFSGLGPSEIIEEIFPLGHQVSLDVQASTDEGSPQNVLDLIHEHAGEDLLIVGAGGVGKTTALVKILQEEYGDENGYDENTTVPIYVELNNAPEKIHELVDLKNHDGSAFILCYIASLLRNVKYSEVGSEMLESIRDEFRKETAEPEYLLLLDGLNEVSSKWNAEVSSSVQGTLILEIRKLLKESPNIRAIVTSRTEHNGIDSSGEVSFTKISLSGISDDMVYDYIKACNHEDRIPIVENNAGLRECLHIPLFLMMYCGICGEYEDITSRGEIFRYFWNEVTEKYSQSLIAKNTSDNREMSAAMRMFILDFIAPALCDEMERSNSFSINFDDAEDLIKTVLSDDGDTGILGKYGKKCFEKYIGSQNGYRQDVAKVAQRLAALEESINRILIELTNMDVLYESGDLYGVRHHFFRDYFAAVHTVNLLNLAVCIYNGKAGLPSYHELAFSSLQEFIKEPIHRERAILVGEYLGEHKNAPIQNKDTGNWVYNVPDISMPCDRNLISRSLDVFRGRFDGSVEYGVYNLVQVLKHTRKMLAGENLTCLDFGHCSLNNTHIGLHGSSSTLRGSKLTHGTLFCEGHSDYITSAKFSPDGTRIVTTSIDNTSKILDPNSGILICSFDGHSDSVNSVEFAPDNTKVVTASDDNTAKVWDAVSGTLIYSLDDHSDWVNYAMFSSDGTKIVSASTDSTAKIWNADSGKLLYSLNDHSSSVRFVVFSPDGTKVVTASADSTVKIWNAISGMLLYSLNDHTDSVRFIAFNTDGTKFATASLDNTAKIWSTETGELLCSLNGHSDWVTHAVFSSDGTMIITSSNDSTAKIWDVVSGRLLHSFDEHSASINFAVFSSDGTKVVTASDDGTAKLWNVGSGELLYSFDDHTDFVYTAAFSPDDTKVVTASADSTSKVWSADSGALLFCFDGYSNLTDTDFNQSSAMLITTFQNDTPKVWNTDSGKLICSLDDLVAYAHSAEFSTNGTKVVTISSDGSAKVWDTRSGVFLYSLSDCTVSVDSATFSPDGTKLVTAFTDFSIKVWNANSGTLLYSLSNHTDTVSLIVFSPDSTKLATASYDKTARIWDMNSGKLLCSINSNNGSIRSTVSNSDSTKLRGADSPIYVDDHSIIHSIVFSPDSTKIATASFDHTNQNSTAKIWEASSGKLLYRLDSNAIFIRSTIFSPDGTKLVTTSNDIPAHVWDVNTGKLLYSINAPAHFISSPVFSPDGTKLVTISVNDTVKVWDAASGKQLFSLDVQTSSVSIIAFSPDGTKFVTASHKDAAKVWDTGSGRQLCSLDRHSCLIDSAEFSADGSKILTFSCEDTTKVWLAETGECLQTYRHHYGLSVFGCDFHNLHPDSKLSEEDKAILKQYGAIVD